MSAFVPGTIFQSIGQVCELCTATHADLLLRLVPELIHAERPQPAGWFPSAQSVVSNRHVSGVLPLTSCQIICPHGLPPSCVWTQDDAQSLIPPSTDWSLPSRQAARPQPAGWSRALACSVVLMR